MTDKLIADKKHVVAQHGEWTDHNIHLRDGLYTINPTKTDVKLMRVSQIIADLTNCPLAQLRILDLACLEGQYAIEMARHGAETLGIEGREANIEKARFSQKALNLRNAHFIQDDIRNLNSETHGFFDVVLCLGVYYHLTIPDVFHLMKTMATVCRRVLIIDTYVSVCDRRSCTFEGKTYCGNYFPEHGTNATKDEKLRDLWASLDNTESFWLTKSSLLNLLKHVGFTSVYECYVPSDVNKSADRHTLVAIKGERHNLLNMPNMTANDDADLPEQLPSIYNPMQWRSYRAFKHLTSIVPHSLRTGIKRCFRSLGLVRSGPEPWRWTVPWKRR